MSTKEAYIEKLEAQLKELRSKVDKLKAKAEKKTAEAKIRYSDELAEFEKAESKARELLSTLKESGASAWDTVKDQAERANEGLKDRIIALGKKLEAEREAE